MDRSAIVHTFDQILEGYDISVPSKMLHVKQDAASEKLEHLPYSLLTNLAHAVMWQEFWLKKLAGGRRKHSMTEWKANWREPAPEEWEGLRAQFLSGLVNARRIAASEPFDHKLPSDDEAVETLVRIVVHGAYHLGQFNLLKRAVQAKTRRSKGSLDG